MDIIEESLIHFKDHWAQTQIGNNNNSTSWLVYASFSSLLGVLSCVLTTYWGPGAAGSGVAEIIGYLNGVNYPDTISYKTFLTKVFGVVLAIAGGLTIGKEGPLAHIGANVGTIVIYLFGEHTSYLKNDERRRHLIAAGASAGVSIAFGAPIGGALFIFELTKVNTFWTFQLLWKTFLTCSSAVFFLAVFEAAHHGEY
jgi:H+/Cl- antiporter ClcA